MKMHGRYHIVYQMGDECQIDIWMQFFVLGLAICRARAGK